MSSGIQLKRRIGGIHEAPSGNNIEGELAVYFPGAAGDPDKPTLYANDGAGFREINPGVPVGVQEIDVPVATPGNTVSQDIGAMPQVALESGSVVVFNWKKKDFLYTGNAVSVGTGTNTVPAAELMLIGSAEQSVEVLDWSARLENDLGLAYSAWTAGPGTPTFSGATVLIKWKDQNVYVLTDLEDPTVAANYIPISNASAAVQVADFTAFPSSNTAADIGAAYTAYIAASPDPIYETSGSVIAKFGEVAPAYFALVDSSAPELEVSWKQISPETVGALTFKASVDVTADRMDDTDALSPTQWLQGSFGLVAASGTTSTIANAQGGSWLDIGVPATVNQGDMLVWDGSVFHVMALETDLNAFLPLVGGTLEDGAGIIFDTTTALAGGDASTQIVIDGQGGTVKDVTLDGGIF